MKRWEKINAVKKMQDYVESHLHEPITLKNLAEAAGYSPWHVVKIFKELLMIRILSSLLLGRFTLIELIVVIAILGGFTPLLRFLG